MIGQTSEEINGIAPRKIALRDASIIFLITTIVTLIANPPFDIALVEWLKSLYVPLLTAALTAVVSYANAIGVKGVTKK